MPHEGDARLHALADLLASLDAEQRQAMISSLPAASRAAIARLLVERLAGEEGRAV
ncbi:MAG: hypothetical protein ABFD92_19825 [Planctomycetaceae bacterium]|nr:hypothetical protein [Planctomycetaceae bacterium]